MFSVKSIKIQIAQIRDFRDIINYEYCGRSKLYEDIKKTLGEFIETKYPFCYFCSFHIPCFESEVSNYSIPIKTIRQYLISYNIEKKKTLIKILSLIFCYDIMNIIIDFVGIKTKKDINKIIRSNSCEKCRNYKINNRCPICRYALVEDMF